MWDFARKNRKTYIAFQGGRTTSFIGLSVFGLSLQFIAEFQQASQVTQFAWKCLSNDR